MRRTSIERRLVDGSKRLAEVREELRVGEEQLVQLQGDADDARLRALVAEMPVAEREHVEARRHAEAMVAHLAAVRDEMSRLEQEQNRLLDRLSEG